MHKIPNIEAVARALSRVQRFNGDTLVPWTVLQHTLVGLEMIPVDEPIVRFAWGLHDAEEALTGDIPKPFKTAEQCALGDELRREIHHALQFPVPEGPMVDKLNALDALLAASEAEVLCSPGIRSEFMRVGAVPDVRAMEFIWSLTDATPREVEFAYLEIMEALRKDPKVRSLAGRV